MNKSLLFSLAFLVAFGVSGVEAQQAALMLQNSDAALCHHDNQAWSLAKTAGSDTAASGDTVEWTINAVRGTLSDRTLSVVGFVSIENLGSGPATIGNIVVNLQRQRSVLVSTNKKGKPQYKDQWVSASVDLADATHADAAASANMVAKSSQEDVVGNSQWNNPPTYEVSGARGRFWKNAASGRLSFTDVDANTVWAITPQQSIAPGATVDLLFHAEFNNSVLAVPQGEQVRVEVLVSFGNASGNAGGQNIDIDGSGAVEANEASVRTLFARLMRNVPVLETCNAVVTVTDSGPTTTGDATASEFDDGGLGGGAVVSDSSTFNVSAKVDGGEAGGSVTNTAQLAGHACQASVIVDFVAVGVDPVTGETIFEPVYFTFDCGAAVALQAASTVAVAADVVDPPPPTGPFQVGDYVTYSPADYHGSGAPGQLFDTFYALAFTPFGGLTLGINDGGGPFHHARWSNDVAGTAALKAFLDGSGPNGAFTVDLTNPTDSSGGTVAKQTAALAINSQFNLFGLTESEFNDFSDLVLCNLVGGSQIGSWTLTSNQAAFLNGAPIWLLLDDAGFALSSNMLSPYASSFDQLNELVTALNLSFHNGVPSAFAQAHLCVGGGGGGGLLSRAAGRRTQLLLRRFRPSRRSRSCDLQEPARHCSDDGRFARWSRSSSDARRNRRFSAAVSDCSPPSCTFASSTSSCCSSSCRRCRSRASRSARRRCFHCSSQPGRGSPDCERSRLV